MDKETQVRERVRELRVYYTNLVVYAGVTGCCILVWLLNGGGAFWPVWPIMAFGTAAALQGVRLGQLETVEGFLPFLSPEWEEKQVKTLLKGASKANADPKTSTEIPVKNLESKVKGPKEKVRKAVKSRTKKTPDLRH